MSTNDSGLRDGVEAELNPVGSPDYGLQPERIPDRPADGAAREKWAAYVVALGAHPDTVAEMKREELAEFADRLGG